MLHCVTGFDYRHGLWAEDFKAGLLWRIDPSSLSSNLDLNTEPTLDLHTPTVPSWSWTSINSKVLYDVGLTQVFDAENYSATSSSFASASLERGVSGGEDLLAVWITNMRTSGSSNLCIPTKMITSSF
ncbi:hypothetical protein M7I_6320 [Glarea lozoyensis 74030]|uniref:Uncharacterized protein n=1 Tax=Glarea lozoyensis (strain ATCC 74030 / MF5533) TaxID=1104152 RepID=H0EU88_GLAL7|nr:hypothetical protein M7I_6320 [Glarea lozoyensis 74030]